MMRDNCVWLPCMSRLSPSCYRLHCRLLPCCLLFCIAACYTDHDIRNLPIPQLQRAGSFLFVWVINSKYQYTLDLFDSWGYT